MEQMTFIEAMKSYFGLKPGETLQAFLQEIKALSLEEREWFKANLPSVGYEIVQK